MSVANPINAPAGALNQGCWKRKGSEEDDNNIGSNVKKAKYSWYVTLESESPQPTSSDEDDESIHSVQAQETEYVQDTSDTSTSTWIGSSENGDVVHVEYEVESLSEDDNPFIDGLSSSDPEDLIRVGMIAAAIYDSDVDLADDSDDSRSSRDSEISHADYWTCVQCNASNNNPLFRYCEKCYRIRKNFFPPRPKGRKRRSNQSKSKMNQLQNFEGHELTPLDSGLGSSQCGSQPSQPIELKRTEMERITNATQNSGPQTSLSLSLSQESTDTVDNSFQDSQNSLFSSSQTSDIFLTQPSTSFTIPSASQEQSSICSKNDENRIEKKGESNEIDNLSQQSSICSKNDENRIEKKGESNEIDNLSRQSSICSKNDENRIEKKSESNEIDNLSQQSSICSKNDENRIEKKSESNEIDNLSQQSSICSKNDENRIEKKSESNEIDNLSQQSSICSKNDENRIEKKSESNEIDNLSQQSVRSTATTLSLDSRYSDCSEESEAMKKIRTPTKKSQLPIDPGNNLCILCTVGPKNGILVHGQTSHICCCYRCAKRVWKTTKRCPICNRKVVNVIKAYYA